jgi:tetratricopeptide (TPR) repeat protein
VAADQIPPGTEARMSLWRDRLAGRQLLLVLDDAAGSEQVRPLLPGSGGSLVLVTSRRRLTALEDATAISLDVLPPGEAAGLLVRLAGRAGLSPDDPAVAEIARLCGYLPLAIGMVARQLHHHPAWTAAGRAAELAATVDRLELMATEDVSVAAAFDLSYAALTGDQQRLFRRLGSHPGTGIDGYAAAALDGTGLVAGRRGLEVLYDQCLLTEPAPGRYQMHDLIRAHARALAGRDDPDSDRDQATERLLDYYQYTAARAGALLAPNACPVPASGTVPAAVPALASGEEALAWARAERASLLACLDRATGTGQHARVLALTAGLAPLLQHDGPYAEAITRHATAVRAAQHLGDRAGQATALTNLGNVLRGTCDCPAARTALEEALGIYRDLGDRPGQATALTLLGSVRQLAGDYRGAPGDLAEALGICRDLGDRPGQASALRELGVVGLAIGDFPGAVADLEEALGISRDLGDRLRQATVQASLGLARQHTGDYPGAAADLQEALGICRDLGDRLGQATALTSLGFVRQLTGDFPGAALDFEEALEICRGIGLRHGQGAALRSLGRLGLATGDYPAAARHLEEAQRINRDIGCLGGVAEVLNLAGTLHRLRGDLHQATSCHQEALDLARQIASPWDEAHALAGLGRCALAGGHAGKAEAMLRQALETFQRISAAEAGEVSAELQALTDAPPAAQGA